MTTQGSVDDFRYLMPRLLQGIVEESYSFNPEILFGKLLYAKWLSWPEAVLKGLDRDADKSVR
jgi:hypothetical protein